MHKHKFVLLCPPAAVVLTVGLWIEGRGEYRREYDRMAWRRGGDVSPKWEISYTDHTAFPIQVAGILSIPVATFATPLYPLAQGGVSKTRLLEWLFAVGILWAYMGWRFDNWGRKPQIKSPYRQIIGTILVLFGVVVILDTVGMFHVGLVYRAIGIVWGGAILRHAFQFYKTPDQRESTDESR